MENFLLAPGGGNRASGSSPPPAPGAMGAEKKILQHQPRRVWGQLKKNLPHQLQGGGNKNSASPAPWVEAIKNLERQLGGWRASKHLNQQLRGGAGKDSPTPAPGCKGVPVYISTTRLGASINLHHQLRGYGATRNFPLRGWRASKYIYHQRRGYGATKKFSSAALGVEGQ